MNITKIPTLQELSLFLVGRGGREKGKMVNRQERNKLSNTLNY